MFPQVFNYTRKYIGPALAISYGVYLNYSFYVVVKTDYDNQNKFKYK